MGNINPQNVDILQIKLFLTAAETKSFSQAGEIHHVEQPTISRRIALLEQDLGCKLFHRHSRPIKLTEDGRFFYQQWKPLMEAFDQSIHLFNLRRNKPAHTLSVGMADSANQIDELHSISEQMRKLHPEISLIYQIPTADQAERSLLSGMTDVLIGVPFLVDRKNPNYVMETLFPVPQLVCMLKTNPLSNRDHIDWTDLRDQKFITIADSEFWHQRESVRKYCALHGFEPKFSTQSLTPHGLTSALRQDDEVFLCDRFLRGLDAPHLKVLELPSPVHKMCAIYLKANKNPYIKPFVEMLRSYYSK